MTRCVDKCLCLLYTRRELCPTVEQLQTGIINKLIESEIRSRFFREIIYLKRRKILFPQMFPTNFLSRFFLHRFSFPVIKINSTKAKQTSVTLCRVNETKRKLYKQLVTSNLSRQYCGTFEGTANVRRRTIYDRSATWRKKDHRKRCFNHI